MFTRTQKNCDRIPGKYYEIQCPKCGRWDPLHADQADYHWGEVWECPHCKAQFLYREVM